MSNIRIIVVNHADRFPLTNSATENLCLQNSAFNESPWMVTGTTVTPNTGMGISGANVADTIADTSGVATQSLSQTITVPNDGQVYTCSIYIQTAGASLPRPRVRARLNGGTAVESQIIFDLNNENVSSTYFLGSGGAASDILEYGRHRLQLTVVNNNSGNTTLTLYIDPAYTTAGTFTPNVAVTGSVEASDAQIETGDLATLVVPTTTVPVSGGHFLSTLPVGNLQLEGRGRIARTSNAKGAKYVSGDFNFTASDNKQISAAVLYDHNFSTTAKIRLQLYASPAQTGTKVYDSGLVLAQDSLGWSETGWGGAKQRAYSVLWFAPVDAQSFRMTMIDPSPPFDYFNIKRLIIGNYFSPAINPDYGLSLGLQDSSVQRRTQGGSIRTDVRPMTRTLSCSLGRLIDDERIRLFEALRVVGLRTELFVSVFPGKGGAIERDFSMMGKFTSLPPQINDKPGNYTQHLEISEV